MTLSAHLDTLRAGGLILIPGVTVPRQAPEIHTDLQALLSLPAGTAAFFDLATFDDDDFMATVPDERPRLEQLRDPRPAERVDLRTINRALTDFERYRGEHAVLTVTAPLHGALITCVTSETWYAEFAEACEGAEAQAAAQAHEARQAQADQESAALEAHARRLRIIADHGAFQKLARVKSTTMRTLVAYATAQQPETVAALGEARTRELVQELRDHVMFVQTP